MFTSHPTSPDAGEQFSAIKCFTTKQEPRIPTRELTWTGFGITPRMRFQLNPQLAGSLRIGHRLSDCNVRGSSVGKGRDTAFCFRRGIMDFFGKIRISDS